MMIPDSVLEDCRGALSVKRFSSSNSKGRRHDDGNYGDFIEIDPYFTDAARITTSRSYRRLYRKTQVFPVPRNPHIRTRGTHTSEVFNLATYISHILGLNRDLCRSISSGHDVGHPPYGHEGERTLTRLGKKPFEHHINSVVLLQHVERAGRGLNLTFETLDGILKHSRGKGELVTDMKDPSEYAAVLYADKIAYCFSDLNDAIRMEMVREEEVPASVHILGKNQRERDMTCVKSVALESAQKGYVSFSEGEVFEMFEELRQFMYERVYSVRDEELHSLTLEKVFDYICHEPHFDGIDPIVLLSLFTDNEINRLSEVLIQGRAIHYDDLSEMSVTEIAPSLVGKEIRYWEPDLDWGN